MAFHTNVFRGGEWVTETVDLQAVLKSQAASKPPAARTARKPPRCGLLTTTVVESALANLILPVRLRSSENNDIAFVGDHFVQICELRKDGRLEEVVRKNDFGCRIRNACVVASFVEPELKDEDTAESSSSLPEVKAEDDDSGAVSFSTPSTSASSTELPPQLLMVVLESGDSLFLFIRSDPDCGGRPELVVSRFLNPRKNSKTAYLGFQLSIDPSSRYVAMAAPTDYFIVYELESREQLSRSCLRNEPLNPVRSFRFRGVRGVIHKLAFMHPRPGDHHHIILLLIVVRHGKSRVVIYEWELGDDLKTVLAEEKQGHRMPAEDQMPLLVVPLTVQSAFIAVSPNRISVCTECLHGPPRFDAVNMQTYPPSDSHRGRNQPLWTAWSRPFRLQSYNRCRDCIYLAREDGVVIFLEVDKDGVLDRSYLIDTFPCHVSSAFACAIDQFTDVLLLGSDSGPGGYWKLRPRESIELLGALPNWSPVVDFATTDDCYDNKVILPWQEAKLRKPDRIFATCDAGRRGFITEYRYGLKASIGLDLEYGAGVKRAWLLSATAPPSFPCYLLLLSLPDSSAALCLSEDFSSAREPEADIVPFDLSSSTLALASYGPRTIQVTKQHIVVLVQDQKFWFSWGDFSGLSDVSVSDASILFDIIAISAHTDTQFRIHMFKVEEDSDTHSIRRIGSIDVDGEITCLSLGPGFTIMAGIRRGSDILLGWGSVQYAYLEMINVTDDLADQDGCLGLEDPPLVEGIASIVLIRDVFLLGTRSGQVMALRKTARSLSVNCEKFGMTAANLSCGYRAGAVDPTILLLCDNSLVSLTLDQQSDCPDEPVKPVKLKKLRAWPVDASKPEAPPPPVHYVTVVDMPADGGITPILMVSDSRLLLAELHQDPGPVHRSIPVDGAPNRVIYCQSTQCLVAAVTRDNRPALAFINPDTGEDIGRPTDRNAEPQDYTSGLGKPGDRVLGLTEWSYKRDGNVWNFILVSTKGGRLVVVSTQKAGPREAGQPLVRYWTRFKKEVREPIYSAIGYEEGLIYCFGQTIQWEMLDVTERKLKPLKSFQLDSPATSLRISNGKLLALTSRESLIVLDHAEGEGGSAKLCHADPWRRNGVHFIEVAGPEPELSRGGMVLLADRECGVGGLWVPWQTPERECEPLLEAELGASIRRFRRARTRPIWQQWRQRHKPQYGRLAATADDAEILGVSLNGALYHFTLLSVEGWRLLRFMQSVALASEELCVFAHPRDRGSFGEDPEPRMDNGLEMHVDGDILRRCLEKRLLERLMVRPGHVARLVGLLGQLDEGRHTAGLAAGEEDQGQYFQLAYDVLEYYLQPVM